mgnify:CR=1 FL=1
MKFWCELCGRKTKINYYTTFPSGIYKVCRPCQPLKKKLPEYIVSSGLGKGFVSKTYKEMLKDRGIKTIKWCDTILRRG